jgi:hypothetical protein
VNFKVQLPVMFIFLVFRKSRLTGSSSYLKICQHTTFHGPMLTGAILVGYPHQEFEDPTIATL